MFTLTNPSAITFPRFNADNTVTARTAANFRSDIGAGTVTSVTASGTAGNPISITNTTTTPVIELLSATTGRKWIFNIN
jgi:CTP:molybdopterin cytidylyltransferase MocA